MLKSSIEHIKVQKVQKSAKECYKFTKVIEFCYPFKKGMDFENELEIQIGYHLPRLAKTTNLGWNQEDSITYSQCL